MNKDYNHDLKGVFKAAAVRASLQPMPFQAYQRSLVEGTKPTMVRLTGAQDCRRHSKPASGGGTGEQIVPIDPTRSSITWKKLASSSLSVGQICDLQVVRLQHFASRVIYGCYRKLVANLGLQQALFGLGNFRLCLEHEEDRA